MSFRFRTAARRGALPLAVAIAVGVGCTNDDGVNPNPTPATMTAASGNNQTGTTGAALAQPFVVIVRDAGSAPMEGVTVLWTVVSGGGTVANASTTTNASGEAQTVYTLGPTAGVNTVKASVQGSTLETTFTATGQAPPANNTPAALVLVSGNNQSTAAGTALADPLIVEVQNSDGIPLAGIVVTWSVSGGGAVGTATVTTNAVGRAANTYTAGATGSPTVTAAVQSDPAIAFTFDITVTPNTTPATIGIVSGNNQSAMVSTGLADPLVAVVQNALNQPLQGVTVAWTVTAGGGTLGAATSMTDAQGQASNTYTVGGTAGANTIEAAVQSNSAIKVAFTATATSAGAVGVTVGNNFFNPSAATVSAGGMVTWTWAAGAITHNITWVSGGFANSADQSSGTHQVTFPSAGTFSYYCSIHATPTTGTMRGTVTVQ